MPFSAFLDACVLYPSALRDTLLRVAEHDLYQPLWSERVLAETRNVMIRRGVTEQGADYTLRCMATAFEDALVTGWEDLEASMRNDPKDRHVLAAAVGGHADVVVTSNPRDFPRTAFAGYDMDVQHPDVFLCHETCARRIHRDPGDS